MQKKERKLLYMERKKVDLCIFITILLEKRFDQLGLSTRVRKIKTQKKRKTFCVCNWIRQLDFEVQLEISYRNVLS